MVTVQRMSFEIIVRVIQTSHSTSACSGNSHLFIQLSDCCARFRNCQWNKWNVKKINRPSVYCFTAIVRRNRIEEDDRSRHATTLNRTVTRRRTTGGISPQEVSRSHGITQHIIYNIHIYLLHINMSACVCLLYINTIRPQRWCIYRCNYSYFNVCYTS